MFSLQLPHRGDPKEYTQYTIFNINTKNHPKLSQTGSYKIFSKGLKNEVETAMVNVVNQSSVFLLYSVTNVFFSFLLVLCKPA